MNRKREGKWHRWATAVPCNEVRSPDRGSRVRSEAVNGILVGLAAASQNPHTFRIRGAWSSSDEPAVAGGNHCELLIAWPTRDGDAEAV